MFVCVSFLFYGNVWRKLFLGTSFEKLAAKNLNMLGDPVTDLPPRNCVLRSENSWDLEFGVNSETSNDWFRF